MFNNKYALHINNFKDIPFDKYVNDFTFYVNGNPYPTNRIIADILSPTIRKFHFSDATLDEFSIKVSCADYFQDFLNLVRFQKKEIDLNHLKCYAEYFHAVGNIAELIEIRSDLFDDINIKNVISQLKSIIEMGDIFQYEMDDYNGLIKHLISFAARHFEEINKSKMTSLPIEILEEILKQKSLTIKDEDSLLDFLLHLTESDQRYSYLFEYVNFQYVSNELLQFFINEFDLNFMNKSIWISFCSKFIPNDKYSNRRYKPLNEESDQHKNYSIFCSDDEQKFTKRKLISDFSSSSQIDLDDNDNVNNNNNDDDDDDYNENDDNIEYD